MFVSKAARRYANALLQLAIETDQLDEVLKNAEDITSTILDSRDLMMFLKSPIIKSDQKAEALQALFKKTNTALVNQFLELLTRKGREDILHQVMAAFTQVYNHHVGIIEVEARTASTLSSSQKKALTKSLEATTNKTVKLHVVEDERLRGGLAVKIGDTIIDGTIKHKLEQLEEKLLAS
ncbi:MAG: ATP synthase F1 subunit delta [Bacteroidota bacterium]